MAHGPVVARGLPGPSRDQRFDALRLTASLVAVVVACAGCPSPTNPTLLPPPPEAPQVTCPADISKHSLDGQPVSVAYTTPLTIGGSPPLQVVCVPASGSIFPAGVTSVGCAATDTIGRQATCGFSVRVTVPPRIRLTRFMAFGDSMTEGVISLAPYNTLVPSPIAYPGRLQVLLSDRYTAQTVVVDNEAQPGESAVLGMTRLGGALASVNPEVVLLMQGANDINGYREAGIEPAIDALDDMVQRAQLAGAVVFLATLPPQRAGGYRAFAPDLVPVFNERVAAVAGSRGAVLVDVYGGFGGVPGDLIGPDGLHPNEAGYSKIAEVFFDAIRRRLEVEALPSFRRPLLAR